MRAGGLQQRGGGAHALGQHERRAQGESGVQIRVQTGPEIPRRAAAVPLTHNRRRDPQLRQRAQLHGQIHGSR